MEKLKPSDCLIRSVRVERINGHWLVAHELVLSFVPDVEQRLWRTVMRGKYQLRRNHVRLQIN
jgi:hypothetical protein